MTSNEAMRLAGGHHQAGRLAEAEALYRQILAQEPNHPEALHLLGVVALQTGRAEVAVTLIRRALEIRPEMYGWHSNLGDALRKSGDLPGAIAACTRAVELRPDFAPGHNNLGNALMDRGQLDEAIASYRTALRLQPASAQIHNHLGNALNHRGNYDEAIRAYHEAIRLDPGYAEAHVNLANAFIELGKLDEAVEAARHALELDPHFAAAHKNLGFALTAIGRHAEAAACHRRAVELEPSNPESHSNLLFSLHYDSGFGPEALLEEHRVWNERHTAPLRPFIRKHENEPTSDRRLRIGYMSPDFSSHVVGHNLMALFRHHDHERFEIFGYSNVRSPDLVTREFRSLCDAWREVVGLPDESAAEMIRSDRIDILVDLALHGAGNRLPLFGRKPAPLQVTYLGYYSTTGLETIDYRVSDAYLDPPGADAGCYSEETLRLPHCTWCYEPAGPMPEVSPLPALSAGFVTFACRNNFAKVSREAFELWMDILDAVPQSRLLLHVPEGSCRESALERLARRGIFASRLDLVGKEPWPEFLRRYSEVDLALDPFPYCGWVTTCDALWMGIPVVTLSGRTPAGRGGRSILSNIGLSELVAESPAQYAEIAITLAGDLPRLAALRAGLRERMERSPMRDPAGLARDLENAYREIWSKWCTSQGRSCIT